jgi:uncharacterized protein (DUF302 family)
MLKNKIGDVRWPVHTFGRRKGVLTVTEYGFTKDLSMPFEEAVESVSKKLTEQGFGILTRIDVREKFKEKLGIDFAKYIILGACDPASAHTAITAEANIGLMLPCNVIVYEKDGRTLVAAIKPTVAMQMIGNKTLEEVAKAVEARLSRIIASM